MNDRGRIRLLALLGPLLHHLPPQDRAEATRLLGPGTFVWPHEPGIHIPAIPREEVPAHLRTADAMPIGEPWHNSTDRF